MLANITKQEDIPECYQKSTLILGCGNILFGDDGFGPSVATSLQKNYPLPKDICVMDVGTAARKILFTLTLGETKVKRLIIIDAVNFADHGRKPGEIFEISPDEIPNVKIDDFSMHQIPSSNLLKELRDYSKIQVRILACQIKKIPEKVEPGLSNPVQRAVHKMCENVMELVDVET